MSAFDWRGAEPGMALTALVITNSAVVMFILMFTILGTWIIDALWGDL